MPSRNKTILVVDDEHDIRESLQEILQLYGYTVLTATNGEDALQVLESETLPALILLDLMMPGMSGFEFMKVKNTDPRLIPLNVVVISADGAADSKTRNLSVQSCLKKPIQIEELLAVAEKYCS